jgi:hypothetical protein
MPDTHAEHTGGVLFKSAESLENQGFSSIFYA